MNISLTKITKKKHIFKNYKYFKPKQAPRYVNNNSPQRFTHPNCSRTHQDLLQNISSETPRTPNRLIQDMANTKMPNKIRRRLKRSWTRDLLE